MKALDYYLAAKAMHAERWLRKELTGFDFMLFWSSEGRLGGNGCMSLRHLADCFVNTVRSAKPGANLEDVIALVARAYKRIEEREGEWISYAKQQK